MEDRILKLFEGKVFERMSTPLFSVDKPIKFFNMAPQARWKGKRIPLSLWKQIQAFCLWTFQQYGSECMLRLYYNEKLGIWKAHAYPQRGVGLSVVENHNHPDTAKQRDEYIGNDFILAGTVHHHCGAKAFQSGTDKEDENAQTGLHITLGDLDEPTWSIHARVRHSNTYYTAWVSDWCDGPRWMRKVPQRYHEEIVQDALCENADSTVSFPHIWQENYHWEASKKEKKSAEAKKGNIHITIPGTNGPALLAPHSDLGKPGDSIDKRYTGAIVNENDEDHRLAILQKACARELERRIEAKIQTEGEIEKRQALLAFSEGKVAVFDTETQLSLYESVTDEETFLGEVDKLMTLLNIDTKRLEEYRASHIFAGEEKPPA
jgi:hypothetical protein